MAASKKKQGPTSFTTRTGQAAVDYEKSLEKPSEFEKRRKDKKLGECCELFDMVIKRDVSREARRGFEVAVPFAFTTGDPYAAVMIYRFPKAPKGAADKPEFKGVTYALVCFCPFCGAQLTRKVAVAAKKPTDDHGLA
jgi:hypothetical protein